MQFFSYILIGIATSFFLFPIEFSFLPSGLNSKMMMAVLGGVFYGFNSIKRKTTTVSSSLLGVLGIALLFNLICIYAEDYNLSTDKAYTTYIMSALTWLAAAYAVTQLIKIRHGEASFTNITYYLAAVCVAQCILALLIENIPEFKAEVDNYVMQGQEFFDQVNRLYGIGAALDPAGTRFAVVLLMITQVLIQNTKHNSNKTSLYSLLIAFFTIAIIGNMIARTTSTGLVLSVILFTINAPILRPSIETRYLKLLRIFSIVLTITLVVVIFLYNTNSTVREFVRFAFEGFFKYAETGEFTTSSTEVLETMWIWPTDTQTWVIGTGLFNNFIYGTDIGYCRFILYCGVVGFFAFALLHVYGGIALARQSRGFNLFFILLIALSFIIWSKVATDLFQFYALLFCLDYISSDRPEVPEDRDSLLQEYSTL